MSGAYERIHRAGEARGSAPTHDVCIHRLFYDDIRHWSHHPYDSRRIGIYKDDIGQTIRASKTISTRHSAQPLKLCQFAGSSISWKRMLDAFFQASGSQLYFARGAKSAIRIRSKPNARAERSPTVLCVR